MNSLSEKINQLSLSTYFILTGVVVAVAGALLGVMGRFWYCSCGYITLWHGNNWSAENSQQLTDWYTFSHLIHGFIFYWALAKLAPKLPLGLRMLIAIIIEAAWEVLENSPIIINRYRNGTVSLDYFGDSVINSMMDILACLVGFWLARKLPVWLSIILVIAMELIVGYLIRDNLFFNVVMLVYPFQFIKNWQMELAPTF
jgi:hypothetical protein